MTESRFAGAPRWTRIASIVAGIVGILLALLGHYIGLGTRGHFGATRNLLLVGGVLIAGAGLAGRRLPGLYRAASLVLLNTIFLLLGMELGSAGVLWLWEKLDPEPVRHYNSRSSYYLTRDWSEQYWAEHLAVDSSGVRYAPWVLWRRPRFDGQMIRIDDQGLRRTPGSVCQDGSYTVFFFGGSTAWGLGSPDWGTIPAYLRQELERLLGRSVCLQNFGQWAFVSTQSLIQLVRELQAERIPNLALFYGGVNDMVTAYQFGEAGLHWDMPQVTARMEEGPPPPTELRWKSNLYRLAWRATEGLRPADSGDEHRYHSSDSLADAVVARYLQTHRLAAALGRSYGFRVETFWQPNVIGDPKPLTSEEQFYTSEEIAELVEKVVPRARSAVSSERHVHDLTAVFAGHPETIYIDWHHPTPEGNQLIAQAIIEALQWSATLPRRQP